MSLTVVSRLTRLSAAVVNAVFVDRPTQLLSTSSSFSTEFHLISPPTASCDYYWQRQPAERIREAAAAAQVKGIYRAAVGRQSSGDATGSSGRRL